MEQLLRAQRMNVFLVGFMGAGKTYWAQLLSRELQLPLLDLDEELLRVHGGSIAGLFDRLGESGFRKLEREMLLEVSRRDGFVLSTGGGTPCFFDNMEIMNARGLSIWLNTAEEVLWQRLRLQKQKRPLIRDLDEEALRNYIHEKLLSREPFYSQAKLVLDPDLETVPTFAQKILACINPS